MEENHTVLFALEKEITDFVLQCVPFVEIFQHDPASIIEHEHDVTLEADYLTVRPATEDTLSYSGDNTSDLINNTHLAEDRFRLVDDVSQIYEDALDGTMSQYVQYVPFRIPHVQHELPEEMQFNMLINAQCVTNGTSVHCRSDFESKNDTGINAAENQNRNTKCRQIDPSKDNLEKQGNATLTSCLNLEYVHQSVLRERADDFSELTNQFRLTMVPLLRVEHDSTCSIISNDMFGSGSPTQDLIHDETKNNNENNEIPINDKYC